MSELNYKFIYPYPIQRANAVLRSSIAYYKNADMRLKIAQIDQARPKFVSGDWNGLLIESAATQLFTYSEDFSDAYWTKTNVTITGPVDGPGDDNATEIESTDADGEISRGSIAAGTYALSIFYLPGTGTGIRLFGGGTETEFDNLGAVISGEGLAEDCADGWMRLSMIYTDAGSHSAGFKFDGGAHYIFGANLTATGLSSYIKNAATRAADIEQDVSVPHLVWSNIPEIDLDNADEENAVPWVAGTYAKYDRVIKDGILYQSAGADNEDDPTGQDQGVNANPKTWVKVSATNRLKPFDTLTGANTDARYTGAIDFIISAPELIDSIGLHNITGQSVLIQVYRLGEILFDQDYELISTEGINDHWDWWMKPRITAKQLADFSLPGFSGALIRVRIESEDVYAGLGKAVFGLLEDVGVTLNGVTIEGRNLSASPENQFGNIDINPIRVIDIKRYDIKVPSERVAYLSRAFKEIGFTPTTHAGLEDDDATIIHGKVERTGFSKVFGEESDFTITVEEI